MKRIVAIIISLVLLAAAVFTMLLPVSAASVEAGMVIISEVKLGGSVQGQPVEFIELFNKTGGDINLSAGDWWFEYAKSAAQISNCANTSWSSIDSSTNVRTFRAQGIVPARGYLVIETSLNDSASGSLRLQHQGQIDDLVGWGSTSAPAPCVRGTTATTPTNSKSLHRQFSAQGDPIVSQDNGADFRILDMPTPGAGYSIIPVVDACPNLDGQQASVPSGYTLADGLCVEDVPDPEPQPACLGIHISEVVPNPSGTDTGHEFVELYNATEAEIDVTGCILQVDNTQQILSGTIAAKAHKAYYGLVLPNAAGGTVSLLADGVLETITYPGGLSDDVSYSLIEGVWHSDAQPTPDQPNSTGNNSQGEKTETDAAAPCPPGKYRNPETNRCRNIEVASSLTPCGPGQVRSPETNRCRKVSNASTTQTPCKSDQYRNPETGRCKKIETTTQTPCKTGYERNPETNRCRKVASATSTNKPSNPASGNRSISYYVIGVVAVFAAGYALYEYRHSIWEFLMRRRQRA